MIMFHKSHQSRRFLEVLRGLWLNKFIAGLTPENHRPEVQVLVDDKFDGFQRKKIPTIANPMGKS